MYHYLSEKCSSLVAVPPTESRINIGCTRVFYAALRSCSFPCFLSAGNLLKWLILPEVLMIIMRIRGRYPLSFVGSAYSTLAQRVAYYYNIETALLVETNPTTKIFSPIYSYNSILLIRLVRTVEVARGFNLTT